jgi:hypothetical protein
VAEGAHDALVSDDLFALAQERLRTKARSAGHPRKGQPVHLLSGMVRCATGHPSMSMYGNVQKSKTYYRCNYGREYGGVAVERHRGSRRVMQLPRGPAGPIH